MLPENPKFPGPAERFSAADEKECDPRVRVGVSRFKDFVLKEQGGRNIGMVRLCAKGSSGHYSGRAWDWGVRVSVPAEHAMAEELIAWLLKNDAEIFRRVGLVYVIWNKRIWTASTQRWRAYPIVPGPGKDPHTAHVHFSFSPEGAAGKTSFFKWLDGKPVVPTPPGKSPVTPTEKVTGPPWASAIVGFAVGWAAVTFVTKRT